MGKIISDLIKAFEYGVDYGMFLAEQERDGEIMTDIFACFAHSQKFNIPSAPTERRQPHSDEWRRVKRDKLIEFIDLVKSWEA